VLIDWTRPLYLNFTPQLILERLREFYSDIGDIETVEGDVYINVQETPPLKETEYVYKTHLETEYHQNIPYTRGFERNKF
jgi:hypothetical protein